MAKKAIPTEEEFLAWRDDPVTQFMRDAFLAMAEQQRAEWMRCTWETGNCDTYTLGELRTRSDAYKAIAEADYSDFVAAVSEEEE